MLRGGKNILKCQLLKRNFVSSVNNNKNAAAGPISKSSKSRLHQLFMAGMLLGTSGYIGWEYYYKRYYSQLPKALDQDRYVALKLLKKEQMSHDSYLLRLSTKQQLDKEFPIPSCLYIKDDTIQVMRPYTPINSNPYKDGYIDILVKRYENGSVSRTLSGFDPTIHNVHVRGPMMEEEYEYKENSLDEIGMIAGGTGISPMYQIICRILENPDDKNIHIWLIYGNKTEQDILLKSELDHLAKQHGDRFKIKYVLEHLPSTTQSEKAYEEGYITQKMIQEMMTDDKSKTKKIFVCGPNKMLQLICGERARDYSQGQVTGILANLGINSNEIFKFQ